MACSEVSLKVYILVIIFGMAAWASVNGLWIELPLFVHRLPEGWALPSFLSIIVQCGNIGPIVYTVTHKFSPDKVKEWPAIYVIFVIGTVASFLLIFFWDSVDYISGNKHSVGLFVLSSFLTIVDCTSSVVFLPYIGYFKVQYITALAIGEGLSGMVPAFLGLFQGLGKDQRCVNKTEVIYNKTTGQNETKTHLVPVNVPPIYSIQVYFFLICLILVSSTLAFTLLHFTGIAKKEKLKQETEVRSEYEPLIFSSEQTANEDDENLPVVTNIGVTTTEYVTLLILFSWVSFIANGLMPGVQSYSGLPYGSIAYTLLIRLSNIVSPGMCLLALFCQRLNSFWLVFSLVLAGTGLAGYQLALGLLSPNPPLVGTPAGSALVILTGVLMTACFTYSKVMTASLLHAKGRNALLWCGVFKQIGALNGSVLSFLLVNVFKLFHQKQPCT